MVTENMILEGMDFSNVTTRRSTQTRAESQEILEMIDMYSKLSLDVEIDESDEPCDSEEENPSTKEFLQTTSALLRTLGEKLVEKIDQITFLQEENVFLKTSMKMEMNSVKDDIIDFKQYMCAKFDKLHNERTSSSSTSSSFSSSSTSSSFSTTSESLPKTATLQTRTIELEEEIKFLKYEIISKNNVIDYLMDGKASDANHQSIFDDQVNDENEEIDEEDDMDPLPPCIEDELEQDCTMEIVERLLLDIDTPAESTHLQDETKQEEVTGSLVEENSESVEEVFIHSFPASQNDLISQRMDDIEKMVRDMKNTTITNDMAAVAPWDNHGNGFASNYMRKNGHQPGKGIGKSENGITVPISAEKKTFQPDTTHIWPKGTVLIAGDSMVGGLEGSKMSRSSKVQVRSHGGATIRDMQDHLNAILRKQPSHLILHAHSNDASNKNVTSDDMYEGLVDLKSFAESKVTDIKVTFSCPIIRTDNTIAHAKQIQLKNRLKRSGLDIIENDGIDQDDLGRKGLHLKPSGSKKLAKNILNYLRSV